MMRFTDRWASPWLAFLADWSVRWVVLIAVLAALLALRPPRKAWVRHMLCLATISAGVLLPVVPRWAVAVARWPAKRIEPAHASVTLNPATPGRGVEPMPDADHKVPESLGDVGPIARPPVATQSSTRLDGRRLAVLVLTGGGFAVVLILLIRLSLGRVLLASLRRRASTRVGGLDPLLDECRASMQLRRSVTIGWHPGVASPVVLGGFWPIVLVPPDWDGWPEADRRACLLHELAHLAHYDDWIKLGQVLLRAMFFFHPPVRWLLARLDREREMVCDEVAVALGTDRLTYARLLLDLARRPGRLLRDHHAFRPFDLPFLDRRTVAVRIERLLEDDMQRTPSRPSLGRTLAMGLVTLAAALGLGGLDLRAGVDPPPASPPAAKPDAPATSRPAAVPGEILSELSGGVFDPDGKPVAGATIVAGVDEAGRSGHQVLRSDAVGRFTWKLPPGAERVCLVASSQGFAAAVLSGPPRAFVDPHNLTLALVRPEPFAAVLTDVEGKPIGGATVRVEGLAHGFEMNRGNQGFISVGYKSIGRDVIGGSPVEALFITKTDAQGSFTFPTFGPNIGLKLAVNTADGRSFRIKPRANNPEILRRSIEQRGYITAPPGGPTRIVAVPSARIAGRVVTKLGGVDLAGLNAFYQESHQSGVDRPSTNLSASARIDADGRFAFDGLGEGTVNVCIEGEGENKDWTYRAAKDVSLVPGTTSEITIELVRGVEVEGSVVAQGTGAPIEGAHVGVYGPNRPRTSAMTTGARTDGRGRYRYRMPAGETYFYVMGQPDGFTRLANQGSSRTVMIPEGVTRYEVPPITLAAAVTLRGRVLDAAGSPVAGATVVGVCESGICRPLFNGQDAMTDAHGGFWLPPGFDNTVAIGKAARLLIRLGNGQEHEAVTVPGAKGEVTVKLPVAGEVFKGAKGPEAVAPDELAGVVVDTEGKPIEGAEVDAWTWYPGHETKTDASGRFRIGKLDEGRKVEVVVRKAGYTPQLFLTQPTGTPGWIVVLGNKTYFEGRVAGPDGKPVAGALIRANCGPKRADGVMITEIWTETKSGDDGRYRLYAQSDVYDIQARVPGVGVARLPGTALGPDEGKHLDISLDAGVTFRAKVVDSLTGEPVAGVRLWHWQHPGVEGRSGADGLATISDMMPGRFDFSIEAPGMARWWSEEAAGEWVRRKLDETRAGWQRNFDGIDFDLRPGMRPVTIVAERGATVTGRVLDPDGKPVAGATVAPALTGTGNSLTGDTRFSVVTAADGSFTTILPASGGRDYNLIAHDGKFREWRTWANGVLPPFRTKPGEQIRDVTLRLNRPATVRGRVTDAGGQPVAGREVRASAGDRLENRYFDPTTTTTIDGTYELKFVRPGEQFIQVAPFWLDARQSPDGTSHTLTLDAEGVKTGVDFRVPGYRGSN